MDTQLEELLDAAMGSYRAVLLAIGQFSTQAHPHYGQDLQRQLVLLLQNLSSGATPNLVRETEVSVEAELRMWAELTEEYLKQKTGEVKEILLLIVATAESISARDQRYATQFAQISTHLQQISDLEDLTSIKQSLALTSANLIRQVASMEQDGGETVAKLRAEILKYQVRVIEVERLASKDALTSLANRREVELQLELKVTRAKPFSVILIDLNDFKGVNDSHGHVAGDDLLKQFASELRRFFRAIDTVGRWGGDEFVVVLDCDLAAAMARLAGLEKWLYGEYTLQTGNGSQKVSVSAVAGAVEWKPGETATQVVARADAAMYQRKRTALR